MINVRKVGTQEPTGICGRAAYFLHERYFEYLLRLLGLGTHCNDCPSMQRDQYGACSIRRSSARLCIRGTDSPISRRTSVSHVRLLENPISAKFYTRVPNFCGANSLLPRPFWFAAIASRGLD